MIAPAFEPVSREEFYLAIETSKASAAFRKQFARFEPMGRDYAECMIHLGHLSMKGRFEAPGFFTLVTGNLHVDGMVDLHNPDGWDEGGLFVVLGDVTCHSFFNEYGKCTFVDGKLDARDLLVAAFGDSALVVTGSLSTNFFFGEDIWAEVGDGATMEYGDGYCLPIGHDDSGSIPLRPRHDVARSLARLNLPKEEGLSPADFRDHLLAGKPLLRR